MKNSNPQNETFLQILLGCDFTRKDLKMFINQVLFLTGCLIIATLLS